MTQTEVENLYDNHVNLLRKLTWNFLKFYGLPLREYEELFSQSNLYFMVAIHTYKNKDIKFSTWLQIQVMGRLLKEYAKSKREWEKIFHPRERHVVRKNNKHAFMWLDGLSEDSIFLITTIYQWEKEFDEILSGERVQIRYIFRFLKELGWSRRQIHQCFKNLKQLIGE